MSPVPVPLDARARWLLASLRTLYDELDHDAQPVALSVATLNSDGQVVTYGINSYDDEVTRLVSDVNGLGALAEAIRNGDLSGLITDATVPDLEGDGDAAA